MRRATLHCSLVLALCLASAVFAAGLGAANRSNRQADVVKTSLGELRLTPLYHGSVMLEFGGRVIHVDPWSQGDYTGLPPADMLVISHTHADHLDRPMIDQLHKPSTIIVASPAGADTLNCAPACGSVEIISNGEKKTVMGIGIEGVAMYNLVQGSAPGQAVSPQRHRQRLHPELRRHARVFFGRHGMHSGNEGAEGHQRRVRRDEPAADDVDDRGRRVREGVPARKSSTPITIAAPIPRSLPTPSRASRSRFASASSKGSLDSFQSPAQSAQLWQSEPGEFFSPGFLQDPRTEDR